MVVHCTLSFFNNRPHIFFKILNRTNGEESPNLEGGVKCQQFQYDSTA